METSSDAGLLVGGLTGERELKRDDDDDSVAARRWSMQQPWFLRFWA